MSAFFKSFPVYHKGSIFGARGHRFLALRRCCDAVDVTGVVARGRLGRALLAPPALHHEQCRTDLHSRQLRSARFVCLSVCLSVFFLLNFGVLM
jgi:hypothetical protein